MYIGYVDEAGNEQALQILGEAGSPAFVSAAPPVFAVAAIFVPRYRRDLLLRDFLRLKKWLCPRDLTEASLVDLIKYEIKGANLRQNIRSGHPRRSRWAFAVLDRVVALLETHEVKISAQVWVKKVDEVLRTTAYPTAIAHIAEDMHRLLRRDGVPGWLVLDSRTKAKNEDLVHTISTRKGRRTGDLLPLLVESPVFGHSDTHALLQLADLVVSSLIYPMACLAYCDDLTWNANTCPAFEKLQARYGPALRSLEIRIADNLGRAVGGITVRDLRRRRPAHRLFGSLSVTPATVGQILDRVGSRSGGSVPPHVAAELIRQDRGW
jgi:hypothetical protein